MISVLLVGYKEAGTIGAQIEAFVRQHYPLPHEILVCASDAQTYKVAALYAKKYRDVRVYKDKRLGKPHALNLLMAKAKGDIFVFSDSDVLVDKNALQYLLSPFRNADVGAVTGRPKSVSPKNTKLGYWSHLLTDVGAHKTRLRAAKLRKFIDCSGYLYATRKIITKMPDDCLSDDAYMGHAIWQAGYRIAYAPNAIVYVKYPATYADWILQKRRSGGGVYQIKFYFPKVERMRSFVLESIYGFTAFLYPKNVLELFWTLQLFFARLHLWFEIKRHIKKNVNFSQLWKPVSSTK